MVHVTDHQKVTEGFIDQIQIANSEAIKFPGGGEITSDSVVG